MTFGIFNVMFLTSMCNTLLGPLLTDIIGQYSLRASMQGVLSAAQSIGSLAALVIGLLLAGRIQKLAVLGIVSALIGLSMLGSGFKPVLIVLISFYLVFGIAKGLVDTLASSSIADMHEGKKQASNIGILHGVFGVGGLLAPVLIMWLKDAALTWNAVYLVFAGLALISFLLYVLIFFKTKRTVQPFFEKNQRISLKAIGGFLRVKKNWYLMGAGLSYSIYQIGYYLWINHYVDTDLGDPYLGSVALALFWIGTAAARILVPRINVSPVKIIIWGNLTAAAVALIGIWSKSAPVVTGCSLIAGFANGAVVSLLLYLGCSRLRENTMLVTVMLFLAMYTGQTISPLAVGAIGESAGLALGITFAVAFAVLSAVFISRLNDKKQDFENI